MQRIALALALACSGCALFVNAHANHNSGGSACISQPVFGLIDIAIAGLSVAVIGATEASDGWYTVPAVFGASGLLGVVSAARCKGDDSEIAASNAPPASNSAPSFGEAPVDPEAREATREELGLTPDPPPPTTPQPNLRPNLRIDGDGLPASLPPAPPTTMEPTLPTCTLSPRKDCPEGYYCKLVKENAGTCLRME